eukprot:51862-Amphidinium_carterae.1
MKRLVTYRELLHELGYTDISVVDGVERGFPLVGHSDLLDYFPVEARPPKMTVDELRSSSRWSSRATSSSTLSSTSNSLDMA